MKHIISTLSAIILISLGSLAIVGCDEAKKPSVPSSFSFKRHDTSTGLPENSITSLAVYQNKIWAGSKKGLFAFDGVNWQIYKAKNNHVLGSDIIEDLKVNAGSLYVATDNGSCCFNGQKWYSIHTGSRARSVVGQDSESAVATAYGVVMVRGRDTQVMGKDSGLAVDEITQVMYDSSGRLWAGTRTGLGVSSGGGFTTYTGPAQQVMGSSLVEIPPKPAHCKLCGNNIKVLFPIGNKMAVGTTGGLCITDLDSDYTSYYAKHKKFVQTDSGIISQEVKGNCPLPGNVITSVACNEDGSMIFIGTNNGLSILNGSKWLDITKVIPGFSAMGITGTAYLNKDLFVSNSEGIFQIEKIGSLAPQKLADEAKK